MLNHLQSRILAETMRPSNSNSRGFHKVFDLLAIHSLTDENGVLTLAQAPSIGNVDHGLNGSVVFFTSVPGVGDAFKDMPGHQNICWDLHIGLVPWFQVYTHAQSPFIIKCLTRVAPIYKKPPIFPIIKWQMHHTKVYKMAIAGPTVIYGNGFSKE